MKSSRTLGLNEQHWIWSLWGVLAISMLYCLVHSLIRLAVSNTIGQDDVAANILAQTLEPGYIVRQGPLYDMLLWAVQQITGPTIISFHLLKYGCLLLTICFLYLSARHILQSALWAAIAALSLSLFYQIGWNIHEGVTHTLTLMTAIAATFWAFIKVCERGKVIDYALLGFFLGLGFLSKHTFGIFVFLLFASALLQKPMRVRTIHPAMFLSLLIMLLVMSPYLLWLSERLLALQNEAQEATGLKALSYLERLGKGVPNAFMAPLGFCFPLVFLLPLVFPHYLGSIRSYLHDKLSTKEALDFEKLILVMMAGAVILIFVGLFVFGIWRFVERYMHPFFLTSLIGFIALAKYTKPDAVHIRRFLGVMLLVAGGILIMRIGILWIQEPFCKPCRQNIPFAGLADAMRQQGFHNGIIIAGYRHEGGNLRQLFPDSVLMSVENPYYIPPVARDIIKQDIIKQDIIKLDTSKRNTPDAKTDIAAVWSPERQPEGIPEQIIKEFERLGIKTLPAIQTIEVPWTHFWRPAGYRTSKWRMILVRGEQAH